MYPIPNDSGRVWDDSELLDIFDTLEVRESRTLDDIPEPPEFWTLQDFEDLLPIEFD